jgi:hypothetical protein
MNKYLAALMAALGLVASGFTPAAAGVLMNETETMVSGQPNGQPAPPPRQQTMMIQGNKQKTVVDGGRVIITDLDKGTTLVINPAQKNYFERPFPPPGRMGAPAGGMHASEFTKTGKTQTVATNARITTARENSRWATLPWFPAFPPARLVRRNFRHFKRK